MGLFYCMGHPALYVALTGHQFFSGPKVNMSSWFAARQERIKQAQLINQLGAAAVAAAGGANNAKITNAWNKLKQAVINIVKPKAPATAEMGVQAVESPVNVKSQIKAIDDSLSAFIKALTVTTNKAAYNTTVANARRLNAIKVNNANRNSKNAAANARLKMSVLNAVSKNNARNETVIGAAQALVDEVAKLRASANRSLAGLNSVKANLGNAKFNKYRAFINAWYANSAPRRNTAPAGFAARPAGVPLGSSA